MSDFIRERVLDSDDLRTLDGHGRARTGTDAAEAAYRKAVSAAVDKLLAKEWVVRQRRKGVCWVVPVDWPESAGSMVEVKMRPGRQAVGRKIADAVAMLPRIIRLLDEAGLCIGELLELLPAGSLVPPRTTEFISRMAVAAEAVEAEEGL